MNKLMKHLHRVFALLICCVFLCCPVFAEDGCSLRVNILDGERGPVEMFNVEICQVTTFDGSEHAFLPEYDGLGFTAAELDGDLSVEKAEAIYQYIYAHEINGTVRTTNANGVANFAVMEKGIYLVFDYGDQILTFQPYLVELPADTVTGPLFHVNSEPKTVSADSRTLLVAVEWIDDNDSAGKRPESVEVTLLRDLSGQTHTGSASSGTGTPFRSVVINENCRWQHTFHTLPHAGVYSVEGSVVPEYELIEIEEVMEGFVLYYKYTPSQTPNPPNPPQPGPWPNPWPDPPQPDSPEGGETLPQTGFRMLPVYALLGIGAVLVLLGMVDLCVKEEKP